MPQLSRLGRSVRSQKLPCTYNRHLRCGNMCTNTFPLQNLKDHFDEIVSAGYSVSLFTDWQNESINEVWIKSRADDVKIAHAKPDFFGAKPATKNLHPIKELDCSKLYGTNGRARPVV